jgi:Protein of unknown function (DUF1552)
MNVIRGVRLSRRAVLRGAGAAIALPLLDAMLPARLLAGEPEAPRRLVFLCVPNGVHLPDWTPKSEGALTELPFVLEPLAPHAKDVQVLTGLALDGGRDHGDGPGDHARSAASFLTGAHPRKTAGADLRVGVSVDQVAAAKLGETTRLPSIELGCEPSMTSGQCDSGYSCAYSANVSWRSESLPTSKEVDPRAAFDRLFGGPDTGETPEERARRVALRHSVLDVSLDEAKRLAARLGPTDRRKLDEYLDAVRELERRIDRATKDGNSPLPEGASRPAGVPGDFAAHIRIMCDLIVLALRTDTTRVATFLLANEGSNRSYGFLGVPDGHHEISHHGGDAAKQEKIRRINRFHVEQLARLLAAMSAAKDGDASLLDRSAVVYGSGISDGNRHNHDDLPILVAGRLGGSLSPGKHVRYASQTPLCNLYLALLDRVNVRAQKFGDSSGRLAGI